MDRPWDEESAVLGERRSVRFIRVGSAVLGLTLIVNSLALSSTSYGDRTVSNVVETESTTDVLPLDVSALTEDPTTTTVATDTEPAPGELVNSVEVTDAPSTASSTEITEAPRDSIEVMTSPIDKITIPGIGVDAPVLPYQTEPSRDSKGQIIHNEHGEIIYRELNPPCCVPEVYQWDGPWGSPGSAPGLMRKRILLGHASDIGNQLIFQDLDQVKVGQTFVLDDESGRELTYRVFRTSRPAKANLVNDPYVYAIPAAGQIEAVLIACLPDTSSHAVVFGRLIRVDLKSASLK